LIVKAIQIPWASWYQKELHEVSFPSQWEIDVARPKSGKLIRSKEIEKAFEQPIGTKRLRDIATGKHSAAVALDDLTRPTDGALLLPYVLQELTEGGIRKENITIIMAIGSHRAMTYADIEKKVGSTISRNYRILNHCPFYNLQNYGKTKWGSDIFVNKDFSNAELKIAVGNIIPHAAAGWGGGAKIVMPGLCGIETLKGIHGGELQAFFNKSSDNSGFSMRDEIEEIAELIGLDFTVNVISNEFGQATSVITGAPRTAHKAGVDVATKIYSTSVQGKYDIGFYNAFPEDTEFIQAGKALNFETLSAPDSPIRDDGSLVIMTAASEGHGVHYLMDREMPLYNKTKGHRRLLLLAKNRSLIFY
jgi:nickel-dependent lactate racemase